MRRMPVWTLLAVSLAGFVKADDIMMTGPKAEAVKKEILDLLNEEIKTFPNGPAYGDFIERHDVDSILYLGGANNPGNQTRASVVNEWRTGTRKMIKGNHHDFRVRVYNNGNVAVVDMHGGSVLEINGQVRPAVPNHILRVYVKNNGVWKSVVQDVFRAPAEAEKKVD